MGSRREANEEAQLATGQPSFSYLLRAHSLPTQNQLVGYQSLSHRDKPYPAEHATASLLERYGSTRYGLTGVARSEGKTRCPLHHVGERTRVLAQRRGVPSKGAAECPPCMRAGVCSWRVRRGTGVLVRSRCAAIPNCPERDTAPSEPGDSLRTPRTQGTAPERSPGNLTSQLLKRTAAGPVLDSVIASILESVAEPGSTPGRAHFGWSMRGVQGGPKSLKRK